MSGRVVQCLICPKECKLAEGQRGDCRSRANFGDKMVTLVFGAPCSSHIDPIEKKPLYHVLPASRAFSIATAGCNLHCKFCQNWEISQVPPEDIRHLPLSPEGVVKQAVMSHSRSIAYTYSEPVTFYEYTLETAKLARRKKILNLLISAGYINPEPQDVLCQYLDAANIDLKGITEKFYREVCFATLKPVQDALIRFKKNGVWVEITNLIVPTLNDEPKDIKLLCEWIFNELGPDTPLHFSRFYPMYRLKNLPPTPRGALIAARDIARETGINYVYIGNLDTPEGSNTYCPKCRRLLVERRGYWVVRNQVRDGRCPFCRETIPGIWS